MGLYLQLQSLYAKIDVCIYGSIQSPVQIQFM